MPQRDGRRLAAAAQEGKRRLRVRLRQEGRTLAEIGASVGVHAQRKSGAFVSTSTNQGKVRFMVLGGPLSAPELHPDEYLNNDLKLVVAARAPARATAELAKAARSRLGTLQRRPDRVRRLFEHPRITYAA